MTRPTAEITADLDEIRKTLAALHAGFQTAKPIAEIKLGHVTANALFGAVANIFGLHETMARVLTELAERVLDLEANQGKIVSGIGEAARVLS